MSTKIIAMCDAQNCHQELELSQGETAIDHEAWGTVFGHDEDYCPECWIDYCEENNVDPDTGKDL